MKNKIHPTIRFYVVKQNVCIGQNTQLSFLKYNPYGKTMYEKESDAYCPQEATEFYIYEEASMYAFALQYKLDTQYSWNKGVKYYVIAIDTARLPELYEEPKEKTSTEENQ